MGEQHLEHENRLRSKIMVKQHKSTGRMLFLFRFVICTIVLLGFASCKFRKTSNSQATEIYRQYVLDPIPESVRNVKVDQADEIGGYRYTLRFSINRADLSLLINSRPFEKVWNVKYRDGFVEWGWDRDGPLGMSKLGYSLTVYVPENSRPDWFRPELWANPEAYAFYKVGDLVNTQAFDGSRKPDGPVKTDVLLYNEKEGEAYFVASSQEY